MVLREKPPLTETTSPNTRPSHSSWKTGSSSSGSTGP